MREFLQRKINKFTFKTEDLPDLFHLTRAKFPGDPPMILRNMAECFYVKGEHENCLQALSYYADETGQTDENFYQIVLECYRETVVNSENFYTENVKLLHKYPYCCMEELPRFADLEKIVLWQNVEQQEYILIEKSTGIIHWHNEQNSILVEENIYARDDIFLCYEFMHERLINDTLQKIQYGKKILAVGEVRPSYFYYSNNEKLATALQLGDWREILNLQRTIILVGTEKICEFMDDPQSVPLNKQEHIICDKRLELFKQNFVGEIIEYYHAKKMKSEKLNRENFLYYEQNQQVVRNNIKSKKAKIMFITNLFSTAIKYHARDCAAVCTKMGWEVCILKEKSAMHQMNYEAIIRGIAEFKPDVIFNINYFRNREIVPPGIIVITWAQDPMLHITESKSSSVLSKNDYILAHSPNKEHLINLGYPDIKILAAKIPANHYIYQPYILTEWEKNKYTADIILVANRSNYQAEIETMVELQYGDLAKEILLRDILQAYYQGVLQEKLFLKNETEVVEYFSEKFGSGAINFDCHQFFLYTRAVAFRSALVEWLIDGGYTSIKLYGNNWAENPKFAPYAMGVAPNGEILSKIYQSAKIVLGSNNQATGSARVYETFLSGGFYISNYIDPQMDVVDIREQFQENEEIPFFYHKQDLYDKLDYYLSHTEKRRAITKKVRDKMLNIGTYEALMRKMIEWLSEEV